MMFGMCPEGTYREGVGYFRCVRVNGHDGPHTLRPCCAEISEDSAGVCCRPQGHRGDHDWRARRDRPEDHLDLREEKA